MRLGRLFEATHGRLGWGGAIKKQARIPRGHRVIDGFSSAAWFDGFREAIGPPEGVGPVAAPRTWLASTGWRRRGLVSIAEAPVHS